MQWESMALGEGVYGIEQARSELLADNGGSATATEPGKGGGKGAPGGEREGSDVRGF